MNHKHIAGGISFAELEKILSEDTPADQKDLPSLTAALIGDAWFTLYVRRRLLSANRNKVRALHEASAKIVSAVCQSAAYHAIENELTSDEQEIFRRARNAKSHAPRSAKVGEYHTSTGFEALLGELYLKEDFARLETIAADAFAAIVKNLADKERSAT